MVSVGTPASAGLFAGNRMGWIVLREKIPQRWYPRLPDTELYISIVKATREINRRHRERVVEKLLGELKILRGRVIELQ